MRVTVQADVLRSVLATCMSAMPSRTPDPLSQCVLLKADAKAKEFCVIYCFDGSSARWYVTGVDVVASGAVVLEPSRLSHMLAEMAGEVTLEGVDAKKLSLAAVFLEVDLDLKFDAGSYPAPEMPKDEGFVLVNREEFLRLVDINRACSRANLVNYQLQGITFWPVDVKAGGCSSLDVVSTDGRVLTKSVLACVTPKGSKVTERNRQAPAMLHNRFIPMVLKMFEDDPAEELCLSLTASAVVVKTARSAVRSSTTNGMYPDYESILSQASAGSIEFDVVANDFVHCVRVASICSCDAGFVKIELGEGVLVASEHVSEGKLALGKSKCEMPIGMDGKGVKFLLATIAFLGLSRSFAGSDMICFRVNLKKLVAFFSCDGINLVGILSLPEGKK